MRHGAASGNRTKEPVGYYMYILYLNKRVGCVVKRFRHSGIAFRPVTVRQRTLFSVLRLTLAHSIVALELWR